MWPKTRRLEADEDQRSLSRRHDARRRRGRGRPRALGVSFQPKGSESPNGFRAADRLAFGVQRLRSDPGIKGGKLVGLETNAN